MKQKMLPVSNLNAAVSLPGSKYLANRLVIIAALAEGEVRLDNVVSNDDINTAIKGLNDLGYRLEKTSSEGSNAIVSSPRQEGLTEPANIYTAHSGTFSRFITAVAALDNQPVTIKGSEKMNSRPMAELFDALQQLGVSVSSPDGQLPAIITGPVNQFHCKVDGSKSSQYISALLLSSPRLNHDFMLELIGEEVSTQYIDMTVDLMRQFGIKVEKHGRCYKVAAQPAYQIKSMVIPPDPVSSSYFMAAAAINGGKVALQSFDFDSLQGEAQFYKVLQAMGCDIQRKGSGLLIERNKPLVAVERDMGEMPDVVQTMAAVACFAKGTTVMRNIAHLAYKESNRIVDTANELKRLGATVEYGSDYLAVTGGCKLAGTTVETYDDHRMAMSLALIGSRIPDVVINNAQVVSKSFPNYFDKLADMGICSESV
jgi:3-phosphoshikimate 1-carboxyvinyltransferase